MMLVARLKAFDDGADSAEGEEKTDATAALLRLLLTGSIDTVNDAAAAQLISVAAAAQLATVLEEPPPHQSTQQAPRAHALAISEALRASEATVLRQLRDGARGLDRRDDAHRVLDQREEAVLLVVRWETNGAGLAAICLRVLRARALKILELSYKKPKKIIFF